MRISQPLRTLFFPLSRYRINRLSLLCAETGHREPHVPPSHESHRGLPALSFQLCRCLLDISPQLLGLGGRTRAAAAAAAGSEAA